MAYRKMAQSLMSEPQTRLPRWANGLIVVGALGVVGVVMYYLYKKSKEKSEKKTSEETVNTVNDEIKNLQQQGGANATPSFPLSTYQATANAVATMLDGCEMNQTELKVVSEIARVVKKPIDWLNLVKSFGVRKIDNCGFGTGDTTYDLPTLLKDQLDSYQVVYTIDINGYKKTGGGVNSLAILRDYLASKGVTI